MICEIGDGSGISIVGESGSGGGGGGAPSVPAIHDIFADPLDLADWSDLALLPGGMEPLHAAPVLINGALVLRVAPGYNASSPKGTGLKGSVTLTGDFVVAVRMVLARTGGALNSSNFPFAVLGFTKGPLTSTNLEDYDGVGWWGAALKLNAATVASCAHTTVKGTTLPRAGRLAVDTMDVTLVSERVGGTLTHYLASEVGGLVTIETVATFGAADANLILRTEVKDVTYSHHLIVSGLTTSGLTITSGMVHR